MPFRYRFEPDALPYARYRCIPHASVLILLLAPRVFVIEAVARFYYDAVFFLALVEQIRNVKTERQITTFVRACILTVDVNFRSLVYGTEMKYQPHTVPFLRNLKTAAIQQKLIRTRDPVESRKHAFRAERYIDLPRSRRKTCLVCLFDADGPFSVEAQPFISYELRPRICVFPFRHHFNTLCKVFFTCFNGLCKVFFTF